jgi:hypothetical protein
VCFQRRLKNFLKSSLDVVGGTSFSRQICPVRNLIILIVMFYTGSHAMAQDHDSTGIPPKPKAGFISNVVFQFDNRNERYLDNPGRMNGLKLGFEFYKRVRTGIGFYGNNDYYLIPYPAYSDSLRRTAKFAYATYFAELVFFRSFYWELSAAWASGRGNMSVNNYDIRSGLPKFTHGSVIEGIKVRDIALNSQFKIVPWFGLGLGLGYRFVYNVGDANLQDAFRDPYVDFKLKFYMGYAFKAIFNPKVIDGEKAFYDYRRAKRRAWLKEKMNS